MTGWAPREILLPRNLLSDTTQGWKKTCKMTQYRVVHVSNVLGGHTADRASLYCNWRWLHLFILMMLLKVNIAGDGTDFHTRSLREATGRSYLLSAISLSRKQPWNLKPCTLSPPWPLQRDSCGRLFDVTVRDVPLHVWKRFCTTHGTVKFMMYRTRRDRRCKISDADEMRTQNSGIYTSLVTICHGKTMHYNVSPNNKRWPSLLPWYGGLDQIMWTACPGTWLGDSATLWASPHCEL